MRISKNTLSHHEGDGGEDDNDNADKARVHVGPHGEDGLREDVWEKKEGVK